MRIKTIALCIFEGLTLIAMLAAIVAVVTIISEYLA